MSRINKWFNEKGEIYLIYTRKELNNELRISKIIATNIFNELVKCSLIKEERIGRREANSI